MFEMAPDGMAIIDTKGVIMSVNGAFLRLTGYDKEDIVGKYFTKLQTIRPKDIPRYLKLMISALRGKLPEPFEYSYVRKDGAIRWGEAHIGPLKKNGKTIGYQVIFREITERKRAEEALLAERDRLEMVTECIGAGLAVISKDYRTLWANKVLKGMFGDVEGKTCYSTYNQRNEICPGCGVKEVFETGKNKVVHEQVGKGVDGKTIWSEITVTPIKDKNGNVTAAVELVVPVTERKKAEEALRESEERYRIISDTIADVVFSCVKSEGDSFVIDWIAGATEKVFGYSGEEVKERGCWRFVVHPQDLPIFEEKVTGLKPGQSSICELRIVKKDGSTKWIKVVSRVAEGRRNPTSSSLFGACEDITERKKIELKIQENQQEFEQLFMGNPEAAVYVDPDERVLNANPRFTQLFGYSFDEVKGRFLDDFVVPEDKRKEALMLAQKGKEGYVYYETIRKNKKGSLIPVALSSSPIMFQDKHLGDVVLYKDITERKKAEEELGRAMEKLDVMNEKLRVVGGLTRHDVRNKLTAVTGNAYLARKKLPDKSEVLDYLKQIETSVEQTVRILEFAKAYEMLGVEELAYLDVEKAVNDAVSLFPGLKDIKVMNDCHGLTVLADSLLRQLFYNLIDNSLKHGEKVSQIRVHHEEGKDGLKLSYEDDGVGIPQAVKQKLFAEGYTTGKGSGYGLYLIKRMMDVYGWKIQESGKPGEGIRFIMTIPRTNEHGKETYQLH